MRKAFEKIANGLREALAVVRGDAEPSKFYTPCYGCGNATLTISGRCDLCGDRKS